MKQIQVTYFAVFREQAGRSQETVSTSATTAAELYEELRARHNFTLRRALVRCSIGLEFVPIETKLFDGAEIVFIPPVAGG